jgi:hypothetical protein
MPLSLSTSSVLFRNLVIFPRFSSGTRSWRTLSNFLAIHARQIDSRRWRVWGYPLRIVLLASSSTSPSGTGALSDCASPSTRGISDSIVWRHAIVCCDNRKYHERCGMEEMDCTSQCCRMAERPPATDLSGGKASEDSFTRLMANLVVEYAVDFQSDLLSCAAVGSTGLFEGPKRLSLGTDRVGSSLSVLRERRVRRMAQN